MSSFEQFCTGDETGEHAECRSLVPRVSAEIFWREGAIVLVPRLSNLAVVIDVSRVARDWCRRRAIASRIATSPSARLPSSCSLSACFSPQQN